MAFTAARPAAAEGPARAARLAALSLALLALVVALTACGRRGALEPPGTPPEAQAGQGPVGLFADTDLPEPPPPDRPFVLDPLL